MLDEQTFPRDSRWLQNGNFDDDYADITLLDDNKKQVDSGKINKANQGAVHFDNAPIGYEIDIDGFCLGSAVVKISVPTSPNSPIIYESGLFSQTFDC